MANCERKACANLPMHPENFHSYDSAVMNTVEMRGIEKLFDAFYEKLDDAIRDFGDMPYPTEYDGMEFTLDEFRDWYNAEVIRRFIGPRNG